MVGKFFDNLTGDNFTTGGLISISLYIALLVGLLGMFNTKTNNVMEPIHQADSLALNIPKELPDSCGHKAELNFILGNTNQLLKAHKQLFIQYFVTYNIFVFLGVIASTIAALCAIFVAKDGWEKSSLTTRWVLAISATFASMGTILPQVFKYHDNIILAVDGYNRTKEVQIRAITKYIQNCNRCGPNPKTCAQLTLDTLLVPFGDMARLRMIAPSIDVSKIPDKSSALGNP